MSCQSQWGPCEVALGGGLCDPCQRSHDLAEVRGIDGIAAAARGFRSKVIVRPAIYDAAKALYEKVGRTMPTEFIRQEPI